MPSESPYLAISFDRRIYAVIRAERTDAKTKGYKQQLKFPLRVSRAGAVPSPLMPVFALFEDPEYNRCLLSETLRAQGMLVLASAVQLRVTLVVDRREYNPTSRGYAIFSIAQPPAGALVLPSLHIVTSIVGKDRLPHRFDSGLNPSPVDNTIYEFSIGGHGQPGETLPVQLVIPSNDAQTPDTVIASLEAHLVAQPVVPAVEAAFALLRHQQIASGSAVACVRFAWSPAASRIELLNPDDLLNRETVRRRAIFHWTDIARKTKDYAYRVQKIMAGGPTYVPLQGYVPISKTDPAMIQHQHQVACFLLSLSVASSAVVVTCRTSLN
jgi:hypothetical protein